MSLRLRVGMAVAAMLAITVLAAWMLAGGAVLRPLVGELAEERADTAVFIAREVLSAADPRARARELSSEEGVRLRLVEEPPPPHVQRLRSREADGATVLFSPMHRETLLVALGPFDGPPYLAVHFRTDLERPQRRVGAGLLLLAVVAALAAAAASRWMLRPLELASSAMARVADGDLGHRVQAGGGDAAGQIGRAFNRMADRVQAMVHGQRDLMAAVSHELRTPLTRMRLQVELLREGGADESRLAALEADVAEVDGLVGELLESARLHQGRIALKKEPVVLRALVDQALAAVDLGDRPVEVDVDPGLVLEADAARLGRVLRNLLSNIVRYTPAEAGVEIRATPSPSPDGAHVVLVVADRGPGVPEEALPRLFEPFFRVESSRSRKTGGLGLGLMLVRQIVEAHGGSVHALNRPAGGLMLRMALPVVAGEDA